MLHYFTLNLSIYAAIGIWIALSLAISALILGLSFLLAIQTPDNEKTSAYECGFEPFEDARNKFDVRFYIIAILFLLFDMEIIYLFPWSISLYSIGFQGCWIMILFLFILIIGFVYEIIKKALDWQ